MQTIQEIQNQIVADFELFDDWDDRYAYIIEMGKNLTPIPVEFKTPEHIIKGCQSTVWLGSKFNNGIVDFYAESDAIIVKGLVSLLIKVYSGHPPEEIMAAEPFFIDAIGMKQHLSMTRSNGLSSMIKQMKMEALAYN